jgi:hypothetical protein
LTTPFHILKKGYNLAKEYLIFRYVIKLFVLTWLLLAMKMCGKVMKGISWADFNGRGQRRRNRGQRMHW